MDTEERYLRVWVKAPMDYLLDYGRYSETDPVWDEIFKDINSALKPYAKKEGIEISAEEWE
ncbi:hypothetical protein ACFLXA_02760 [Chloroflexota bacterium]